MKREEKKSVRPLIDADEVRFRSHADTPRNQGMCLDPSAVAVGVGSCGDRIQVDLKIESDRIAEIKCLPDGCVYTIACASAMSVLVSGRSLQEALGLQPEDVVAELGGLPDDHVHCARLAINTLGDAIAEYYRLQWGQKHPGDGAPSIKGNEHADS